MSRKIISVLVLLAIAFQIVTSQSSSPCFFRKTCVECLDADYSCAWCTDESYDMHKPRCGSAQDLKATDCKNIETNQDFNRLEVIQNDTLRDYDSQKLQATLITPQRLKIQLGKVQSQTFKFTYKPAKNYPLDLYYLMDLTWSMKDDRDTLINMGDQLAKALANLTENYRLGFGSFIDKPTMPFIQTEPDRRQNPCGTEREVCDPTYGFRHRLKITKDTEQFIEKLKNSSVSANLDNLEGGLDALMQVLVCGQEIGWGSQTRKIVILATNGLLHMAGDGLLAGITEKNDKQCHLSESGEYTGTLEYDYPSLEEIYRVLGKSKTAVIFAVPAEVQDYYRSLSKVMMEFTSVGMLQDDSSNILQLVDVGYREFVKKVEFTDNAPSYVEVSYATDCGGVYTMPQPTSKCDNIEIGKEYDFYVEIKLKEYPTEEVSNLKVRIEETLTSSEAVELEIDIRKSCLCEQQGDVARNSAVCNEKGDYSCGMCHCHAGWVGKTCECDLKSFESSVELLNQCRAKSEHDETGPICSDRGECFCGECLCNPGFEGPHCECRSCVPINGVICSNHGECECGDCKCDSGWSGEDCSCSTDQSTCKAPHKQELCSGQGECVCGKCHCKESYFGSYCEVVAGSGSELCTYYEECVRCAIHQKLGKQCDNIANECKTKLGRYNAEFFDIIDESFNCTARITNDDLTCDFKYTYELRADDKLTVLKINDRDCTKINVQAAAFGLALATVLIGLLLIGVFRLKTYLEDRRLYRQFEQEQATRTSYQMTSPLYKSPITSFQVPEEMADTR